MDKSYIEGKVSELKDKFALANISLLVEYLPKDDLSSKTEAQVDLKNWKLANFILKIFPSFFELESKNKKEFIIAHELMHIRDVLNANFKYDGALQPASTLDKYVNLENTIWEILIDMRLEQDGYQKTIDYCDRFQEYQNTHWPELGSIVTLDLNLLERISKNPTCLAIKELAKTKVEEWQDRITESYIN